MRNITLVNLTFCFGSIQFLTSRFFINDEYEQEALGENSLSKNQIAQTLSELVKSIIAIAIAHFRNKTIDKESKDGLKRVLIAGHEVLYNHQVFFVYPNIESSHGRRYNVRFSFPMVELYCH